MSLDEKLKNLVVYSQERFKFIENPDEYVKRECEDYKKSWENRRIQKKWFETNKHFQKRLELFNKDYNESCKSYADDLKKLAKEALVPVYVYYKGDKIKVPNSFYTSFWAADIVTYLEYLEEEDKKKHIITDEDREKARILDCNLDYNYLQTLINKINKNPDLRVTIRTNDGATITLDNYKQLPKDEDFSDIVIEKPTLVK